MTTEGTGKKAVLILGWSQLPGLFQCGTSLHGTEIACPVYSGGLFCQMVARTGLTVGQINVSCCILISLIRMQTWIEPMSITPRHYIRRMTGLNDKIVCTTTCLH